MTEYQDKCQKIIELAKRRGFFWPSYEIYGGEGGFEDYGPLGSLLKRKIEYKWIDFFIRKEGIMLIETPILTPAVVFDASGHTSSFTDPVTTCLKCGRKWRADQLLEEQANVSGEGLTLAQLDEKLRINIVKCPECYGEFEPPKAFNELFKTTIGPYSENIGYGRPETAQGIFVNFKRLYELARSRLPFGIAQTGKCLRNEISPRQGPVRLRELTIMEFEFFFDNENADCKKLRKIENETIRLLPEKIINEGIREPCEISVREALNVGYIKSEWNAYFMFKALQFAESLGIPTNKQYFIEKFPSERAHYSAQTYDQLVELSRWGAVELSGHALRSDYDLKMHMKHSGKDLRLFSSYDKPVKKKKLVIEPNRKLFVEKFGSDSTKILKSLMTESENDFTLNLKNQDYCDIKIDNANYRISSNMVNLKEIIVEERGRRFLPHVAEPSFGLDRHVYAILEYSYSEKDGRTVLKLPRDLSPYDVAIFPLMAKDGLPEKAQEVYKMLIDHGFMIEYDETGSIGKRYARIDETGIPLAITIDYETLQNDTVTIRDRDSWKQLRKPINYLPMLLNKFFKYQLNFKDFQEK